MALPSPSRIASGSTIIGISIGFSIAVVIAIVITYQQHRRRPRHPGTLHSALGNSATRHSASPAPRHSVFGISALCTLPSSFGIIGSVTPAPSHAPSSPHFPHPQAACSSNSALQRQWRLPAQRQQCQHRIVLASSATSSPLPACAEGGRARQVRHSASWARSAR